MVVSVAVDVQVSTPERLTCRLAHRAFAPAAPVAVGAAAGSVVHVAHSPQPGLLITSTVAVHAPLDASSVVVRGGLGVGPVASPAEQLDVGAMHAMKQWNGQILVVVVETGVAQGTTSLGRVLMVVICETTWTFPWARALWTVLAELERPWPRETVSRPSPQPGYAPLKSH